ncbi:hypothetical protein KL86PLE_90430 [uncultured Pleomorphomonas sp.]|uniref:Uncharacterized protein n=1 Tax=uncultured Pleomorphomonas sp. TaxID=442121 RepID=A0A212LPQ6_9HYPH|nr:hypothetical protein KL86PLE_90430 [uncultured Pleomorphomonas sp.]
MPKPLGTRSFDGGDLHGADDAWGRQADIPIGGADLDIAGPGAVLGRGDHGDPEELPFLADAAIADDEGWPMLPDRTIPTARERRRLVQKSR